MKIRSLTVTFALLVGMAFAAGGCTPEECRQMARCCDEIEGEEGVGGACGEMAEGVKDADTCRSVLETAQAMFEKRDERPPKQCR